MRYSLATLPKNLPKKEKIRDPDSWGHKHSEYHDVNGVSVWRRVKRICKAYTGKQFNKAFTRFCSEVPVYQQKFFLEEFNNHGISNSDYWNYYFIDKQGNIQKHVGEYYINKRKNKRVYYYSDDYKTENRHKVTGAKKPEFYWMYKNKYKEEDYISTVIAGYFIEFKSAKDPKYIRLIADQMKRKKAASRLKEKEAEAKTYTFITKSEKELVKEKAKNRIKIEVKGFDYETSFRNIGINPDIIKEHQGFTK